MLHERTGVAKSNANLVPVFTFYFHVIALSYAFVFGIATETDVFQVSHMSLFSLIFHIIGVKGRFGMAFVMA